MNKYPAKEKNYSKYPELLDIHVARLKAANEVVHSYLKDSELLHDGFVVLENFLGAEKLVSDIKEQIIKVPVRDEKTKESLLVNLNGTPAFVGAPWFYRMVISAFQDSVSDRVTHYFWKTSYLQHLLNRPDDGDDQKVFHTDTFFHCVKYWYFPMDVSKEAGAFWYVPGSPVVTDRLIKWHEERVEDMKAGRSESWRGQGHLEGSFRINEEELAGLGLNPEPIEVKADSFVMANVFGFHRRGDTQRPTHRVSVHGSIRIDPF